MDYHSKVSLNVLKSITDHCLHFSAFERGHCYEPYIQNGNFTTTDPTYSMGTVVEFTCDPGHSLEQGPSIIECINIKDPYWNDTEPLCRGKKVILFLQFNYKCCKLRYFSKTTIWLKTLVAKGKGYYFIVSSNQMYPWNVCYIF